MHLYPINLYPVLHWEQTPFDWIVWQFPVWSVQFPLAIAKPGEQAWHGLAASAQFNVPVHNEFIKAFPKAHWKHDPSFVFGLIHPVYYLVHWPLDKLKDGWQTKHSLLGP